MDLNIFETNHNVQRSLCETFKNHILHAQFQNFNDNMLEIMLIPMKTYLYHFCLNDKNLVIYYNYHVNLTLKKITC